MTYEPGQQVLVRGVVANVTPDWVHIEVRDPRRQRGRGKCFVDPADVVGPATATPDEFAMEIDGIKGRARYWAEGDLKRDLETTLAALAAAEARIAAALSLLNRPNESPAALRPLVRRALSVEATGTEGGGGHE